MTKIEEVIRQVSDLRDFYVRLQRMKKAGRSPQGESPASSHVAVERPPSLPDATRQDGKTAHTHLD